MSSRVASDGRHAYIGTAFGQACTSAVSPGRLQDSRIRILNPDQSFQDAAKQHFMAYATPMTISEQTIARATSRRARRRTCSAPILRWLWLRGHRHAAPLSDGGSAETGSGGPTSAVSAAVTAAQMGGDARDDGGGGGVRTTPTFPRSTLADATSGRGTVAWPSSLARGDGGQARRQARGVSRCSCGCHGRVQGVRRCDCGWCKVKQAPCSKQTDAKRRRWCSRSRWCRRA